jgi:hypothetical protein
MYTETFHRKFVWLLFTYQILYLCSNGYVRIAIKLVSKCRLQYHTFLFHKIVTFKKVAYSSKINYHKHFWISHLVAVLSLRPHKFKRPACWYFFLVGWDLRHQVLRPLLAYCTAPNYRWGWLWSNLWNEDWQGKPKYSEKTCPSATLSTTNPTWPDPGANPGRRGGMHVDITDIRKLKYKRGLY